MSSAAFSAPSAGDSVPRHARRHIFAGAAAASVLGLTGCGLAGDDDRTITMIVTESAPFQEPTELVKEQLEEDGWTLETTYVTDIIQPNQAVAQGEYDANFFQHISYLRQFNEDNDTEVTPAFSVYYAPSGIFSLEHDSVDEIPEGAQIAIPVDTSNNGRALKMLADEGLIEVDESQDVTDLSQSDITDNPRNIEFIEVDQQSTPQSLPDVDAAFAFARLVAEADYDVEGTALIMEDDPEVETPYTVVVAAQPGFEETEKAEVLQEAFQSEEVEQWYADYLGGTVEYSDAFTTENIETIWGEFAG
ncbi:MetQ/NlpA family ABC transporter substrate-binding protein [Nesterenkonia aerolata]|uniref:MetQ/NlpA family ABC transporter substrate-binding protein n=1 Tax=Nesterenkonia aerolata TaxID=3074079 RepID=A0ABU2DR83_9MICC|nr:MetQ/NlpA family ABC transporter substrate-binding protein [Nesterenkonia sp. LY-0111]MDR8019006.1 MetQ/NlpA family ABC transporter substrate-binding protein [Nesterenkonia sp. LY-0111]